MTTTETLIAAKDSLNFIDKIILAVAEFSKANTYKIAQAENQNQIIVTDQELEILLQSIGARKKLLRGKIRNNQSHMAADDKPDWSEKDYKKAINMRKRQLADADMLMTRLENI